MHRFFALVNIFAESSQIDSAVITLSKLDNIEEVYQVAGEYDIVALVSASTLEEFRDVLQKRIMKIEGVRSTITTVVLKPHKGAKCQGMAGFTS